MPAINLQTSATGPKLNLRVGNTTYVLGEQKTETVTETVYVDKPVYIDREVPVYVDREVKVYVDKYVPLFNFVPNGLIDASYHTAAWEISNPIQETGTLSWTGSGIFVFGAYTSTANSNLYWKKSPAFWVRDTGKVSLGFTGDNGAGKVLGTTTNALSANTDYNFTFKYKPSESRLILTINGETLNQTFTSDFSVKYMPHRCPYSEKANGYVFNLQMAFWDGN